jgi:hypothetical protein
VVRRGLPPETTFNFDEDPRWWPYVPPTVFSRDLEAFPRTEEHIPEWLRAALVEAAEFEERNGVTVPGTDAASPGSGGGGG